MFKMTKSCAILSHHGEEKKKKARWNIQLIAFNNIYGLVELGTKSESKRRRRKKWKTQCSSLCFTANLFIKHKRQSHTNYLTSIMNAFFCCCTMYMCCCLSHIQSVLSHSWCACLRAFFDNFSYIIDSKTLKYSCFSCRCLICGHRMYTIEN